MGVFDKITGHSLPQLPLLPWNLIQAFLSGTAQSVWGRPSESRMALDQTFLQSQWGGQMRTGKTPVHIPSWLRRSEGNLHLLYAFIRIYGMLHPINHLGIIPKRERERKIIIT